jgi:hypothetical protein
MGVTATANAEPGVTPGQTTQTANGAVLQAADLTMLLPAAAAPIGAQIHYTNLFTMPALTAVPTVATPIVAVTPSQPIPMTTLGDAVGVLVS